MTTFFASFVVWVGSLFSYYFFMAKIKRNNREVIYALIKPSVRQGFFVSGTLALLLFLQLLRVLSLWDALLVILVPIFFEIALRQSPNLRKGI